MTRTTVQTSAAYTVTLDTTSLVLHAPSALTIVPTASVIPRVQSVFAENMVSNVKPLVASRVWTVSAPHIAQNVYQEDTGNTVSCIAHWDV